MSVVFVSVMSPVVPALNVADPAVTVVAALSVMSPAEMMVSCPETVVVPRLTPKSSLSRTETFAPRRRVFPPNVEAAESSVMF